MKKLKLLLPKLLVAGLILSFLNIDITETGCNIWGIWGVISEGSDALFTKGISYLGMLLLVHSVFVKSRFILYASSYGVLLLWVAVGAFYPYYWDGQREHLINAQYLFILFTAVQLTLNGYNVYMRPSIVR